MRDNLLSRFGALIRDRRMSLDRTQVEVASRIGVSQPSYSAYETGLALPTVPVLLRLISELNISPAEVMALLPDDDHEPNGDREVAA